MYKYIILILFFFNVHIPAVNSDIDKAIYLQDSVKSFYQHQEDYEDSVFQYRPLSHSFFSTSSMEADTPSLEDHQESSFFIYDIVVEGVVPIPSKRLDYLLRSYENCYLTLSDIKELIDVITHEYHRQGYITSSLVFKDQSLDSGVLTLTSIGGVVTSIQGISQKDQISLFSFMKGNPLNIFSLEEALSLSNRLNSYQLAARIIPDKDQFGGSILAIHSQQSRRSWMSSLSFNNSSTHTYFPQYFLMSIDNLAGFSDQFRFIGSQLLDRDQQSRRMTVAFDMPIYRCLASFSHTFYESTTMIKGLSRHYYLFDTSIDSSLSILKTLRRSNGYTLSVILGTERTLFDRYLEDVRMRSSSYRLSRFNVGVYQDFQFNKWGDWTSELQWITYDISDDHYTYERLRGTIKGVKRVSVFKRPFICSTLWTFQYSQDNLYPSEQLSIGGYYTIRGFSSSFRGNKGAYARHECKIPLTFLNHRRLFGIFVALDGGIVGGGDSKVALMGASVGSEISYKTWQNKITLSTSLWSHPIMDLLTSGVVVVVECRVTF